MKKQLIPLFLFLAFVCLGADGGCSKSNTSRSGVDSAVAEVKTGGDGLTAEQRNIKKRKELFNKENTVMHLYVFEGRRCAMYSTVKVKATSSGKRLAPKKLIGFQKGDLPVIKIDNNVLSPSDSRYYTNELLGDDGTYGSSEPRYIYWFNAKERYCQFFVPQNARTLILQDKLTDVVPDLDLDARTFSGGQGE